jgi:RNA polymerase sigma-70 factor (ECF subfamily)
MVRSMGDRWMDDLTADLLAARAGDRRALTRAIAASQADVFRLCAHLVGRDGADDAAQDTYLRAVRALPAFRGEASGRTWLLSIARRACADEIRARVRHRRRDREQRRVVEADAFDRILVDSLIARLDVPQREAFVCTQVLGLSYEEAAGVCAVPVGTIRSRVARARATLLRELQAADAV